MKTILANIFKHLPIYAVVIVLLAIAIPKSYSNNSTQNAAATSNNTTTVTASKDPASTPRQVKESTQATESDASVKAVAEVAKITIDSVKDKYDSLKDMYQNLFSVIAALGALFAFFGFKGAESFIKAKERAEESLRTSEAAQRKADETLQKAEAAQQRMNKFESEIYPRNNKAEVNITTGIVFKYISDLYKIIISRTDPNHNFLNDEHYVRHLRHALYYLDSVETLPELDRSLRNRTASVKGNVYKLLKEYERAIATLESRTSEGVDDDDSIMFNLACYYTLKSENEAASGFPTKSSASEDKAIEYLIKAIRLNPENRRCALEDDDFAYFRNSTNQRFAACVKEPIFCDMKGAPGCPATSE